MPPGTLGGLEPAVVTRAVSAFDRTRVVSAIVSYELFAGIRAGGRFVAYSALPYTATRESVPVGPLNGERMPAFYRVDVRVEKRWRGGKTGTLALVVEGMNVTFHKAVLEARCQPEPRQSPTAFDPCTFDTLGPVAIPSIGLEGQM